MRRTPELVMRFSTLALLPSIANPSRSAVMPMIVRMQVASAAATRSVGEKASPRPWLSTGASVWIVMPEGPCTALQRRPPS